jgi:D-3-phosphoglycerate dehydrogenase / 2-oxoglutarate reductase
MSLCLITDYMGDDVELERELLAGAGIDVEVARSPEPDDWTAIAERADAILTRHAPVRVATIMRLRRCRVISRYGTGHDNIDVGAARDRGIEVAWVSDYCTDEVADHALALILASARHLQALSEGVRGGGWTPHPHPPIVRLRGRRLGLLGCGRIGSAVAQRALAFGLQVSAYDPYTPVPAEITRVEDLDELVAGSQILSLHAPLTSVTAGILDKRRLALLPNDAIVVNVARGGLIDLDAAVDALRAGRLSALAVDVLDREPPPADHPLRELPGALLTPHLAYYSSSSVEEAKRRSVAAIVRVLGHSTIGVASV